MNQPTLYLLWGARLVAAIIMLQTLFFKFTGASESVYIFSTLGVEPWGRIGSGVIELIASLLILYPRTSWIGAGLALGVMTGAILAHMTVLGIPVQGDGGYLFFLALTVAAGSVTILLLTREQWLPILAGLTGELPALRPVRKSV
ncbi:DoxX family protein [Nibrella viscosa]|uniref:DoxX family protein n=1 Tax=Nibrella viscosa TaxID=1084524 RepID=A0ABP8KHH1_9BACT